MKQLEYRSCQRDDLDDIMDICFRTGFMGTDLTGTGKFEDRHLFGMIYCRPYVLFETHNCFVVTDSAPANRVIGYIIGTQNTAQYEKQFSLRITLQIVLRMFLYTVWRHPKSFQEVICWHREERKNKSSAFPKEYPAHLHINILSGYQGQGIGRSLIQLFEQNLISSGIRGVHLVTSNHNKGSISFYKKMGYEILMERKQAFWKDVKEHSFITMGKKLKSA